MPTCRHCGSYDLYKRGTKVASNFTRLQRYSCRACGRNSFEKLLPPTVIDTPPMQNNDPSSLQSIMSLTTKDVATTWRAGNKKGSCHLIIPKELAIKAGVYEPCNVVVESTEGGLWIKKLEVTP